MNGITPFWIESVINNDRDMLKLSSAGIIFIGGMLQFISVPICARQIIFGIYAFSALAFLTSLFTAIYKLQINSDLLFLLGSNKMDEEYDRVKVRLKYSGKVMRISFTIAVVTTMFLLFSLLTLK